jgi:hypothetical protein
VIAIVWENERKIVGNQGKLLKSYRKIMGNSENHTEKSWETPKIIQKNHGKLLKSYNMVRIQELYHSLWPLGRVSQSHSHPWCRPVLQMDTPNLLIATSIHHRIDF